LLKLNIAYKVSPVGLTIIERNYTWARARPWACQAALFANQIYTNKLDRALNPWRNQRDLRHLKKLLLVKPPSQGSLWLFLDPWEIDSNTWPWYWPRNLHWQFSEFCNYKYLTMPRPSTLSFVAWSCFFFGAFNCCNFLFICHKQSHI
jgi:hypothetical protein